MDDRLIYYIKELELIVLSAHKRLPSSREDVQHLIDCEKEG